MNEVQRLQRNLSIRRPKLKRELLNDARIRRALTRFQYGACTRLEFLTSVSHCADVIAARLTIDDTDSDTEHYSISEADNDEDGSQDQLPPTATNEP